MTAWDPLFILLSLAAAAGGAWFGSYLREKGKRYATSEDLNKVLEELRLTTRTTEDIKATISNDFWMRQNAWTLKRDVYLGLLTSMHDVAFALRQLDYIARHPSQTEVEHLRLEFGRDLSECMAKLRASTAAAEVVLPGSALDALGDLDARWIELDRAGPFAATHRALMGVVLVAIESIRTDARADLGLAERSEASRIGRAGAR